jgi:predicted RNase H-like nuclease
MDPLSASRQRAIEVYPHPATIALFELGRTLKYKARVRDALVRKSELEKLIRFITGLQQANPALHLDGHPDWVQLCADTAAALRPFQLSACEDPIDAVLCAYVALYAERRPDDVKTYGDFAAGYIVTPRLPRWLNPTPRGTLAESASAETDVSEETSSTPVDTAEIVSRISRIEMTLAELQREVAVIRAELSD